MLNMDIKKIAAISICSVLVAGSIPAYAESTGSININASINSSGFEGEIYVILSDIEGNQRLALLTPNNNYKYKLDDLQYSKYQIKEIRVFNTTNESDENRQSMIADYSLSYDSLNLNEENQNPSVIVDIHSLKTQDKKESSNEINTNKSEINTNTSQINVNDKDSNNSNDIENSQEIDNSKDIEANDKSSDNKEDPSVKRRKNFMFWSFIIDVTLIVSLGSVWFFKIKRKENK